MTEQVRSALVTGGAGFIGSHLTRALVQAGTRVRVLDDLSTGKPANLADVRDRIDFVSADVRDADAVRRAAEGVEAVFHLAAMVSVPQSVAEPRRCHDICATGTLNVLLAAKEAGVRRVVYAASSSAYGETGEGAISEATPTAAVSPYAAAKLAGEHYCTAFAAALGLETVRLRFFNVFGPNQDPSSPYSGVISIFVTKALANVAPTIFGDGLQTRDFVYVGDVVQALRSAATAPKAVGNVYNVGRGTAITVLELWRTIAAAAGCGLEPNLAPPRAGDIRHSLADVSAARRDLGFVAQITLADGVARCLESYRRETA